MNLRQRAAIRRGLYKLAQATAKPPAPPATTGNQGATGGQNKAPNASGGQGQPPGTTGQGAGVDSSILGDAWDWYINRAPLWAQIGIPAVGAAALYPLISSLWPNEKEEEREKRGYSVIDSLLEKIREQRQRQSELPPSASLSSRLNKALGSVIEELVTPPFVNVLPWEFRDPVRQKIRAGRKNFFRKVTGGRALCD